jgi:hypothetical protein
MDDAIRSIRDLEMNAVSHSSLAMAQNLFDAALHSSAFVRLCATTKHQDILPSLRLHSVLIVCCSHLLSDGMGDEASDIHLLSNRCPLLKAARLIERGCCQY